MYFETDKKTVWEPENQELKSLYAVLEKHAPSLSGSKLFDELIEVYETLDSDLKEAEANEPVIRAV